MNAEIRALLADLENSVDGRIADLAARAAAILAANPPPAGKTVRVRVAVAMTADGQWSAIGYRDDPGGSMSDALDVVDGDGRPAAWITADIPLPEVPEIAASVEVAS